MYTVKDSGTQAQNLKGILIERESIEKTGAKLKIAENMRTQIQRFVL